MLLLPIQLSLNNAHKPTLHYRYEWLKEGTRLWIYRTLMLPHTKTPNTLI
jgi:hypothetical protein